MNGPEPVAVLEAMGPEGIGLRVEFVQHGQRYSHRLVAFNVAGISSKLLEAEEGDLRSPWPCSPAFQGLNLDDLRGVGASPQNASPVAMLIGMSGDAHWSMAVKAESSSTHCGVIFEAAARVKSLPPQLTSTYRTGSEQESWTSETKVSLSNELGKFELRALPLGDGSQRSCLLHCESERLRLAADVGWNVAPPTTLQWRYGVWLV